MPDVTKWNLRMCAEWIDDNTRDFTPEQQLYMANRILNNVEEKKRFMTEHQGDNQTESV